MLPVTHGSNSISRGLYYIIGGTRYKCVQIGSQIWMAENLDYDISGSYYYDDDQSTYGRTGKKYGRLYPKVTVDYLESNKSTFFPGWHVPSLDEFKTLRTEVGYAVAGTALKSTTDWSDAMGDGSTEFNAFPSGYRDYAGLYLGIGTDCRFWTTDSGAYTRTGQHVSIDMSYSYYVGMTSSSNELNIGYFMVGGGRINKTQFFAKNTEAYSVRLVKDT